MMQSQKGWK